MIGALLLITSPLWAAGPTDFCWVPSPSTDVAGYHLYKCSTTPCSVSTGTLLKNVLKSALTTRTDAVGKVCTSIPVDEGYATVTAYDTSGNESGSDGTVSFDKLSPNPATGLVVLP